MSELDAPRGLRLVLLCTTLASGAAGQYWLSVSYAPARAAIAWSAAGVGFFLLAHFGHAAGKLLDDNVDELPRRLELLLLAGTLGVGVFFGFYHFRQLPPGLNHDAAWEGLYAIRILRGESYTPYVSEAWGRETFTLYLRALSIWLMGPSLLAVVLPSMLAGVLTLPFFYSWARSMFGVRPAQLATWLLGVSGWHLLFSRIGWRSDFEPLFTAITCCFFIRGLQTHRWRDFALSGLGLALTLNTYNAARALPLLFILWMAVRLVQSPHRRTFLRRNASGVGVMSATFAIAVMPLAWYAVTNWGAFEIRAAFLAGKDPWLTALKSTLLLFNFSANGDDFFLHTPGLEYPAAVFLPFGILWGIREWRDQRVQFLLLGLIVGVLPGLLTHPNLNRDIGAMLFVYFFVALGVLFFVRQLQPLSQRVGRTAATVFIVAASAAAANATYTQYLGTHARGIWGFYPEPTIIGRYIKSLGPGYNIYVGDSPYFARDTITYMSYQGEGDPQRRSYTWLDDISVLLLRSIPTSRDKGLAFIFQSGLKGHRVMAALQQRYRQSEIVDLRYQDRVFATALLVPPESARMLPPPGTTPTTLMPTPTATPTPPEVPLGVLHQPRGLAVTSDEHVVVCDFGNNRLQQLGSDLQAQRVLGAAGSAAGQFKQPCGIAIGPSGEIFVADTWNHRVQVLSKIGKFERSWTAHLYAPRGIAVDAHGAVFVADTGNNRIVRFSAAGQQQREWGGKGTGHGQFIEPVGVATDASGKVYVCDNGNARLQMFTADGDFVQALSVPGWRVAAYSEPYVALDAHGTIWVTVPLAQEIRNYDHAGSVLRTLTPSSVPGITFSVPMGIAYTPNSPALIVSDLADRVVRIPLDD